MPLYLYIDEIQEASLSIVIGKIFSRLACDEHMSAWKRL